MEEHQSIPSFAKWFSLVVVFYFVYSFLVYTSEGETTQANVAMSAEAQEGRLVFQKYNCTACHQIYGLGGYMGPDLTNIMSLRGRAYASVFIQNGTNRMPNLHLSEEELQQVLAFLEAVDGSGLFPVKDFEIQWNGTVEPAQ